MSKLEGLEFLMQIYDALGWDNIDLADLELITITVKAMESEKK